MKTNEKELKQKIADLEFENSELHLLDVKHLKKIIDLDKENQLLKNRISDLSIENYHLKQEKEVLRNSNKELIEENKKLKEYENDYRVLEFILEQCKFKLSKIETLDIINNCNKNIYFIEIYNVRNYHDFIALEITEKQYNLFNLLNLRRI